MVGTVAAPHVSCDADGGQLGSIAGLDVALGALGDDDEADDEPLPPLPPQAAVNTTKEITARRS
jgi:hypothetical protein